MPPRPLLNHGVTAVRVVAQFFSSACAAATGNRSDAAKATQKTPRARRRCQLFFMHGTVYAEIGGTTVATVDRDRRQRTLPEVGDNTSRDDHRNLRGIDVIGDVHGHAAKLERLLEQLGYRKRDGAWSRQDRLAIFVGDLIDRGPQQLETITIVRRMVDVGAARCVLGNHEYNAVAWATRNPDDPGEYLRERGGERGRRHRHQHAAFLDAVGEDTIVHRHTVDWLSGLPLWLDLGFARVVHACWDPEAIRRLSPRLRDDQTLTAETLVASARRGSDEHRDIETLLKGPEVPLPTEAAYTDKDGNLRRHARHAWWNTAPITWDDAVLLPRGAVRPSANSPLPVPPVAPYTDPVPVFFGHYWFTGKPAVLRTNTVCVDYSAGNGGPLTAYRHDRGDVLDAANFFTEP